MSIGYCGTGSAKTKAPLLTWHRRGRACSSTKELLWGHPGTLCGGKTWVFIIIVSLVRRMSLCFGVWRARACVQETNSRTWTRKAHCLQLRY